MPHYLAAFRLAACSFVALAAAVADGTETLPGNSGQLGVPPSRVRVAGTDDQFYLAQETSDGRLFLTPNEAFFPSLGLLAEGKGSVADINRLNGGKSFATITRWDQGDVAEWGLLFRNRGDLVLRVWMTAPSSDGELTLQLGDTEASFSTKQSPRRPIVMATAKWKVDRVGRHSVKLICRRTAAHAKLHWIEVSGEAAKQGAVLRKRWRPAAAHARFSSSRASGDIRLWVIEMDATPGTLGFYSPITTPFGYYGPTWQADGTVGATLNFSMWSFARGRQAPPLEQLSHLIAVGHPRASLSGFSHEGTGVKVRNWKPLAGRQGQRQVLALRVEPGDVYDTYYGHFYATDERRWRFFAAGNKYTRHTPLKSLWAGSFVEVPGPPHVQRSGPYPRTMRYRGWVMENNGAWHRLDQMTNGNVNRSTGLTHTRRGVTKEGWFYLQTGGWIFHKPPAGKLVTLPPSRKEPPIEYLTQERVAALMTIPAEITASIARRTAKRIQGHYQVRGAERGSRVTLHWGSREGLTFANRWEHSTSLGPPREGENDFVIDGVPHDGTIYVRLLLENPAGRFWSRKTLKIEASP